MEVAEMKKLRFAMEVTRKDKIRNKYIRGTVQVERLGMKIRYAKVVLTCHEERPRVCRKKDGNGITGKEEKRRAVRPKRRFLNVVKKDMGKVGAKETDVENRTVWRKIIRCGYS